MKWFNLPGAKAAYLQTLKLKWVGEQGLDIPWIKFYASSPMRWDFFALTFPEQAWILKQIQAIDRSIDKDLDSLEGMLPFRYKPKFWAPIGRVEEDFSGFYQNIPSMQRHRELILHYTMVLDIDSCDEEDTDRISLETFRSACIELVETACLRDRARLIKKLLSEDNTAALLSAQTGEYSPIWGVRREAVRRGSMIHNAMQKMREILEIEEDEETDGVDEEDDSDSQNAKCICNRKACTERPAVTTQGNSDLDQRTQGTQYEISVLSSNSGTVLGKPDHEMEGDWTSVVDESESQVC